MKFSFEFLPELGLTWPQISIGLGQTVSDRFEIGSTQPIHCDFDVDLGLHKLKILYHKTENETVVHNGHIVKDQSIKLNRIWIDDVLMEPWVLTEGCYFPQYFDGILTQFPDWPQQLPSQLIWHFPGEYHITFEYPFWPWYSQQRKKFSLAAQHTDKDSERWENWGGSDNMHQDLVDEIYRMLNV